MKLEKGPIQPKASQRKETIKIKTEINEVGNKNNRENQWNQNWFSEISKTDKPLARFIRKRRRNGQHQDRERWHQFLQLFRKNKGTSWMTSWNKADNSERAITHTSRLSGKNRQQGGPASLHPPIKPSRPGRASTVKCYQVSLKEMSFRKCKREYFPNNSMNPTFL